MLRAVTISKFSEGHPAQRAVTWRLSSSQSGLGCRATPGKTQPGLTRSHLASAASEYIECSNCCDMGLNQPSNDTTGHFPWWLHLAPVRVTGYTDSTDRTLGSHSSCQLCPEGFITVINAQWLKVRSRGASGQHLCRETLGGFAVPQEL